MEECGIKILRQLILLTGDDAECFKIDSGIWDKKTQQITCFLRTLRGELQVNPNGIGINI